MVQRVRPTSGGVAPIPSGWVDTRSITELQPEDIPDSGQCHFFAGIGGWGLAFRLAGIPDDAHAWSASLPCQPFSIAGQRRGIEDDRHLFPVFYELVRVKRPPIILGEQVASADGLEWLAGVHTAMENAGYLFASADLSAASVGAPHVRQRLYWGAWLPDSNLPRLTDRQSQPRTEHLDNFHAPNGLPDSGDLGLRSRGSHRGERCIQENLNRSDAESYTEWDGWEFRTGQDGRPDGDAWGNHFQAWADGTTRRTEPGLLPLAHGFPERVGLIRGFGNAIVPQVAKVFIEEFWDACRDYRGGV